MTFEWMERLIKQRERLEAQKRRIREQKEKRQKESVELKLEPIEEEPKPKRRRGWKVVEMHKAPAISASIRSSVYRS